MKNLLLTAFILLNSGISYCQIKTEFPWGQDISMLEEDEVGQLYGKSENLLQFNTQIDNIPAIFEYQFENGKAVKASYRILNNPKKNNAQVERFKKFEELLNNKFGQGDFSTNTDEKLWKEDPKRAMKNVVLTRKTISKNWRDSINSIELTAFSLANNLRLNIDFQPLVKPDIKNAPPQNVTTKSDLPEPVKNSKEKPSSNKNAIVISQTGGTHFFYKQKELKFPELLRITSSNPEAYRIMRSAKSNMDIGFVLSSIGGFAVGYVLGTGLAGGEIDPVPLAMGIGLIGVAIPLGVSANKKAKQAVKIYNDSLD